MTKGSITKVKDLFFILIIFAIILSLINIAMEKIFFNNSTQKVAINNAINKTKERERVFKDFIDQSRLTLKSIRETKIFNKYLEDNSFKGDIENIFLAYAVSQPTFMQLRYIDKNGLEKIRVDRDKKDDLPYIIKKDFLQNKANRYYFKNSKKRPQNKVWFSSLDLNIENGKIETPYKPTLRAVYPIAYKGKFHGILIINYLMTDFLKHLTNTPLYDSIIFNDKGYILTHYDKNKSWSFYTKSKYKISDEFPNEYKNIFSKKVYKTQSFVSRKFDVPLLGGINILLQLKKAYLIKEHKKSIAQNFMIIVITFLSSLMLTIFIVKFFSKTLLNLEVISKLNKDLEIASKIAKIGFWEYDAKTQNLKWNDGLYHIFEITKKEKMTFSKFLSYVHIEDRARLKKNFEDSIKEKREYTETHKIVTKNNNIKYVEERAIHIFNKDGSIEKSLGTILDITDLKENEMKLYRAEKLASMGEMIENIAHQWRQPLSIISTISTSYKVKEELNIDIETPILIEDMNTINDHAQYLSRTIDDFRNFIKDSNELKNFNLKDNMKNFLMLIESSVKSNYINMIVEKIDKDITIKGYPNELIQCFINIFNNAKDALNENNKDKKKYIFLSEKIVGNKIIFKFKDNAGGISKDILPKIFEPYFTTKYKSQGTGIGLHMTYNLVVQTMKGTIEVKNVKYIFEGITYKGAEFKITLPKDPVKYTI